jgi:hypothetical protein
LKIIQVNLPKIKSHSITSNNNCLEENSIIIFAENDNQMHEIHSKLSSKFKIRENIKKIQILLKSMIINILDLD